MRAYVIKSQKAIDPFGNHPQDCLIANETLKSSQKSILSDLNIEIINVDDNHTQDRNEHLTLTDSLYFNKKLMAEFILKSRKLKKNTVCGLKRGISTLRTVIAAQDVKLFDDRVEFGLHYYPPDSKQGEAVPIVFDTDRRHETLRMPQHLTDSSGYDIPLPDKVAVQIDHWTNLWSANIASLLASVAEVMNMPKWKLLVPALRAGSLNQWKVASKMNRIGRNCDIHPAAYVEGCVIGNNVTIGAGSVVRESNIADNVTIENNVTLNFSVVGEGGFLADGSNVRYSVIYPGTFFGFGTLSCQLLGKDCFVGDGVTMTDYRLDGKNISVLKNGRVIDTGNRILGSCMGHNSYLAAGSIIAPGRAIPNGTRLTPENSRFVQKIMSSETLPGYRLIDKVQ
jgi:carbonic anhydrase/acetyltransferase-like protein (isoleucine patch superfamily)